MRKEGFTLDLKVILQDSLLQLVCGYLFISVFNFVSIKRNTKDISHLLLSSFAIGFIIVNTMSLIPISINYIVDNIGICLSSILVAYILARLITISKLEWLLDLLKIRQSIQKNPWAELMDTEKQMKMKIILKDNTSYYGYIHYISEDEPALIALAAYQINDEPCNLDGNKILLVNTADMKYAEIIYHPLSDKTERITKFTDVVRRSENSQNH